MATVRGIYGASLMYSDRLDFFLESPTETAVS
jgi:hypothetical protein